jgi:hypothetical protein
MYYVIEKEAYEAFLKYQKDKTFVEHNFTNKLAINETTPEPTIENQEPNNSKIEEKPNSLSTLSPPGS